MRFQAVFLVSYFLIAVSVYSEDVDEKTNSDAAIVIATDITPITKLVKSILPDTGYEVIQILPEDADPHHFALSPSQANKMANADFVIGMGEAFNAAFVKLAQTKAKKASSIYWLSQNVVAHDDHDDHDEHDHGGENEMDHENLHVWLSIKQQGEFLMRVSNFLGLTYLPYDADLPDHDFYPLVEHDAYLALFQDLNIHDYAALSNAHGDPVGPKTRAKIDEELKKQSFDCMIVSNKNSELGNQYAKKYQLPLIEFDPLLTKTDEEDFQENYRQYIVEQFKAC